MSEQPVAWWPNARVVFVSDAVDKGIHTTTGKIVPNATEPNCGILLMESGSVEMVYRVVTDGLELIQRLPIGRDFTSDLGKILEEFPSEPIPAQFI